MKVRVILKSLKNNCVAKKIIQFIDWQKNSSKDFVHIFNVCNKFETKKKMTYFHNLKCNVL